MCQRPIKFEAAKLSLRNGRIHQMTAYQNGDNPLQPIAAMKSRCGTSAIRPAISAGSSRFDARLSFRTCEPPRKSEPIPIWLAALFAARCRAMDGHEAHAVQWICISGRAMYTNAGAHAELIEPLGIKLQRGQTLAVCWMPGETAYTIEVHGRTS